MGRRVDDYFPDWAGCGKRIREKDGRHVWVVNAVVYNTIKATSEENGWKGEFLLDDVEAEFAKGKFLRCGDAE